MKQFYFLCALFISSLQIAQAQSFSLKDLMDYSPDKADKFTTHLLKKDYRRNCDNPDNLNAFVYHEEEKGRMVYRTIQFSSGWKEENIVYQTSCETEKWEFDRQMQKAGFVNYSERRTPAAVFQKDGYTITVSTEKTDSTTIHTYALVKRELPKIRDIVFAEDLLALTSHEYIAAIFGHDNVVKDMFKYSEEEKTSCTILFPGTAREVIFIWTDQDNLRDLELMVLGGSLQGMATTQLRLPHNQWRSSQGVYAGMTLKDLELKNGGPVSFYGWASEMPGTILPSNAGNINFKKLGLVLNCLNCDESSTAKLPVVNSAKETDDRRIYVTTLILVPEREKQVTAQRQATALR